VTESSGQDIWFEGGLNESQLSVLKAKELAAHHPYSIHWSPEVSIVWVEFPWPQ